MICRQLRGKFRIALRRIAPHCTRFFSRIGRTSARLAASQDGGMPVGLPAHDAPPLETEIAMRARRVEQTALTAFLVAACVTFGFAVFAAQARNTLPPQKDVTVV
jgi:hypothetical protein